MIPKKLKPCSKTNSFIVDENNEDVLLVYNNFDNSNEFKNEVIKRYNDYNLLKTYVIILSITVTALIFKLWLC